MSGVGLGLDCPAASRCEDEGDGTCAHCGCSMLGCASTLPAPASIPAADADAAIAIVLADDVRADLVRRANAIGRSSSRRGAPVLAIDSHPELIARWLQWCDGNGCHTAQLAIAEGFDPYTIETAWEALANMLEDS